MLAKVCVGQLKISKMKKEKKILSPLLLNVIPLGYIRHLIRLKRSFSNPWFVDLNETSLWSYF